MIGRRDIYRIFTENRIDHPFSVDDRYANTNPSNALQLWSSLCRVRGYEYRSLPSRSSIQYTSEGGIKAGGGGRRRTARFPFGSDKNHGNSHGTRRVSRFTYKLTLEEEKKTHVSGSTRLRPGYLALQVVEKFHRGTTPDTIDSSHHLYRASRLYRAPPPSCFALFKN